ncbi:MAG: GNAT family N-acyltransferase [Pseudomonadota bacterium]
MRPLTRGRYLARLGENAKDVTQAQALRHLAFHGRSGLDQDSFDALCQHMLVEDAQGDLVACCRLQIFADGDELQSSYSAQSYDLSRLARFGGPKLELGRFCLKPGIKDPNILRLIWGALTVSLDGAGVTMLFGCTSFAGADPARHAAALATLHGHAAPLEFAPGPRAVDRFALPTGAGDPLGLPPLLRSYLAMGAWVSDHAVIDRAMNTVHVLTALPVAQVPPARARALRAIGAQNRATGD